MGRSAIMSVRITGNADDAVKALERTTTKAAASLRTGATRRAGVIRAGRKAVPYAGPINYGWPAHHISPRLFVNTGVAQSEPQWQRLYLDFINRTLSQIQGA